MCHLTPLDYFLWDYVKAYVYTEKSALIDAMEDKIEAFIREIPGEMLERVCQINKDFMHFSELFVSFFFEKFSYSS